MSCSVVTRLGFEPDCGQFKAWAPGGCYVGWLGHTSPDTVTRDLGWHSYDWWHQRFGGTMTVCREQRWIQYERDALKQILSHVTVGSVWAHLRGSRTILKNVSLTVAWQQHLFKH